MTAFCLVEMLFTDLGMVTGLNLNDWVWVMVQESVVMLLRVGDGTV